MKTFTFIFDADYGTEELWTSQVIAENLETAKNMVIEQERDSYDNFDYDDQISMIISIDHETKEQNKYL